MSEAEEHAYMRLVAGAEINLLTLDFDLDAFAEGILAHRDGAKFHDNPDGTAATPRRLCWSIGWNERALRQR